MYKSAHLTVAVLLPLVFPDSAIHTGALGGRLGPLQDLAFPQGLLVAVGDVHRGVVVEGDDGLGGGAPGLLAHPLSS